MDWRCRLFAYTMAITSLNVSDVVAQQCREGSRVEGQVLDPDGASVPSAQIRADSGTKTSANATGDFVFACIPVSVRNLWASAPGFQETSSRLHLQVGQVAHVTVRLALPVVQTEIAVNGEDGLSLDPENGIGTHALTAREIRGLSDDPDDLMRQLQIFAAANGGAPGQARVTVDGFQGSSALPPKSAIARIVTAPDLFSAEYDTAPYSGGRIEIFTKPGADHVHGALFFTDSEGDFNATDPLSTIATPASKHRYGFELGGPVVKTRSDFFVTMERRQIDEFNIVDATTLGSDGAPSILHQTVTAPQSLWLGSSRVDWQINPADTVAFSFDANSNHLANQGVGGLNTPETGYSSDDSDYTVRVVNADTMNPYLLHESRAAWTRRVSQQTPLSTLPNLNIAGYAVIGGSTSQNFIRREDDCEIDDDILYSRGRHAWKAGVQSMGLYVRDSDPGTFNGTFNFSGGQAPALDTNGNPTGQTVFISPLEQYRRATLNLPGGSPTSYEQVTGSRLINLSEWQVAFYGQDTVKLNSRVTVAAGLRYAFQTSPGTYANFAPRTGLAWAVDRRSKTIVHLHAGFFSAVVPISLVTEAERLDGVRRRESLIYFPNYARPLAPTSQSIQVNTVRSMPSTLSQVPAFQSAAGVEHELPHHWHAQANFYYAEAWNQIRSRNINAPKIEATGSPVSLTEALSAPRPGQPGENVFQYQATGHLHGRVLFAALDQHSYKAFGFFLGYLHFDFKSDTPAGQGFAQSAYSDEGETASSDRQVHDRLFLIGNLSLPRQAQLFLQMDTENGLPYNLTTGTDNNGDGVFNDRPSYARTPGPDTYNTRFGLLSADTVNGDVPRNLGTMPGLFHLDADVSREWTISHRNSDTPKTLRLNVRSTNILNHTNVTSVSSIVTSPTFSQAIAAEPSRRLELGMRLAF